MKIKFFIIKILALSCCVANAQNVGVGTSSPLEKFHVNGNIKADTLKPNALKLSLNSGNGKILTSDANGNASWQSNAAAVAGAGFGYGAWGDCSMNGISGYYPIADTGSAQGDYFGTSVTISGNFAFAGCVHDKVGQNFDQGSVNIYKFDGAKWTLFQKIVDPAGGPGDEFGYSMSVSGSFLVIGARYDDIDGKSGQGSACIFRFNGNSWDFMQKLTDANGEAGDQFGVSVSIYNNRLVVGAQFDDNFANADQGSASIYQFNGISWVFVQKFTDAIGGVDDRFGGSVSIWGDYVVVGIPMDEVNNVTNQGSANIYHFNGGSWIFTQKLIDTAGSNSDFFGNCVSIWGNYIFVGASSDGIGPNGDQGSVIIFRLNGATWNIGQKIFDANGTYSDYFGSKIQLTENYAIIGAYAKDVGTSVNQGAATIYSRIGNGWNKLKYISDPMGNAQDKFGFDVAIDNETQRFLIGANGYAESSGKVVFGKVD